jgi:hypothetical protein
LEVTDYKKSPYPDRYRERGFLKGDTFMISSRFNILEHNSKT